MKVNTSFTIIRAEIILTSSDTPVQRIDIRNNIVEVKFYENLMKPYVDARVKMLDDFGFRGMLSLQGTERIVITVGSSENLMEPLFEKIFFISSVIDAKKVNERSEALSLELVEEHVYVNSVKQISRSFTKNIEGIVTDICQGDLGKKVVKGFFQGSAQGVRKVIVPYLKPLEAINWLMNRATTKTGSPLFLSGDLFSDYLYLSDLDTLMEQEVINKDLPYRFSTATKSADEENVLLGPYYDITAFEETSSDNSMRLFELGAIGSFHSNIDAGTGLASGSHLSVRDILSELKMSGTIDEYTTQSVFDPSLVIDGKVSDEYNSKHVFQVSSSKTYNQFQGYHDEATLLNETNDIFESKLKMKNKVIRHILKKNVIDVGLDGISLFKGKISVGRRVRILFLNTDTNADKSDVAQQIDKKKSGDYLILATSHHIMQENHFASMRVAKLGDLPKNFKL
jgi:hypothetical protein